MLMESQDYRRQTNDDADYQRSKQEQYVLRKREIEAMNLDAYDYEKACQSLAGSLGI